jgi:hypothetical protein
MRRREKNEQGELATVQEQFAGQVEAAVAVCPIIDEAWGSGRKGCAA